MAKRAGAIGCGRLKVGNLVRVTTYQATREHPIDNGQVSQAVLGEHAPALTVIIAGMFDARWLIESRRWRQRRAA
ncbi:MAG: hypothetical protein KA914_17380 [Ottowia sp.]|nr:hypothetical protein [Ottowia sp.]